MLVMMKNRKNYIKARKKQIMLNNESWYLPEHSCPLCGQKGVVRLFYEYDACGCMNCNNWLEAVCTDPDCPFCANRPETPQEAAFLLLEQNEQGRGSQNALAKKDWRRKNYQHKTDGMKRHQRKEG